MTLEEIKRHPSFPFLDFAKNDLSFLMLELYWAELFREIVEATSKKTRGQWVVAQPADRTDWNPILSVIDRSPQVSRQLRVIQNTNEQAAPAIDLNNLVPVHYSGSVYIPFTLSISYDALDEDGITSIEELVIFAEVSGACERLFRYFAIKWCVERISWTAMQQMEQEYWRTIQANLVNDSPDPD